MKRSGDGGNPRTSVGADRPTLMRQVESFLTTGVKPQTERKKTMDDWILDSDWWEPETVEFSEEEKETLEMAIEFFLDGYCESEE